MQIYKHKVQYYETDQMGIVHHSNYVRWFEEARTDFMERMGHSYAEMEEMGIIIPVIDIQVKYKNPAHFGDLVEVHYDLKNFTRARFEIAYKVYHSQTKDLLCIGSSCHATLSKEGRIISLERDYPELHQAMLNFFEKA